MVFEVSSYCWPSDYLIVDGFKVKIPEYYYRLNEIDDEGFLSEIKSLHYSKLCAIPEVYRDHKALHNRAINAKAKFALFSNRGVEDGSESI